MHAGKAQGEAPDVDRSIYQASIPLREAVTYCLGFASVVEVGHGHGLVTLEATLDDSNVMRSAGCQKSLTDRKARPNGAGDARGQRTG